MTDTTPEARLAALGLSLPPPAAAVANYVPWAITGNLVMTSGNLPWQDGKLAFTGMIGRELSGEEGYRSCRLSCLNAIAQIKEAAGELSRVVRIVRRFIRFTPHLDGHRFFTIENGRRIATHWDSCKPFAKAFPKVTVDPDALYVVDGQLWTSAG